MNIQIDDTTAAFLKTLCDRMQAQDNGGTADPFYIVVNCEREVAVPEGTTDDVRYFDHQQAESYTEEEIRKRCEEDDLDFDDYVSKHCRRYDVSTVEEHVNAFLTRTGYDEHMALNKHNYRHYKSHGPYIVHAFRNPEMAGLVKAIKVLGQAIGGG